MFTSLTTNIIEKISKYNMQDWTDFIGYLALVWTIGLFSCGIQICLKIYKDKLVGDISPFPFLAAFLK